MSDKDTLFGLPVEIVDDGSLKIDGNVVLGPVLTDEQALEYRLWLDRQLYGNSFEKVSRVPCEPCQQIGECPRCKNTRFVEVRERVHPLDVIVKEQR